MRHSLSIDKGGTIVRGKYSINDLPDTSKNIDFPAISSKSKKIPKDVIPVNKNNVKIKKIKKTINDDTINTKSTSKATNKEISKETNNLKIPGTLSKSKKIPKDLSPIIIHEKFKTKKIIEEATKNIKTTSKTTSKATSKITSKITSKTTSKSNNKVSKVEFINEKYRNQQKIYKTVKTSLKSIVKSDDYLQTINRIVFRMNKIVIHAYNFFKLFCLYLHHSDQTFPDINQYLIVMIIKTICKANTSGRKFANKNQKLREQLNAFYEEIYKPLMKETDDISYTNLTQMIEYEATIIITGLSNHIQEHFVDMINRIVNIYYKKNEFIELNKDKKDLVREYLDELRILKEDILTGENNADCKFDIFKEEIQENVIKINKIEGSLKVMCENDPLSVFKYMIELSIYSEKLGKKHQSEEDKNNNKLVSIINAFPLRTSVIPKYVNIDTYLIVVALLNDNKQDNLKNMLSKWRNFWGTCFSMNHKVFKLKGYNFTRQISTDGVGCSILFIKSEYYKDDKAMKMKLMSKPKCYKKDIYVDQLSDDEKQKLLKLKKVGIDPGKIELIEATDGETTKVKKKNGKIFRKTHHYRYTNKQRIHETKSDIYKDKILNEKKEKVIKMGRGRKRKSIEEIESELSKYNSSTCIWKNFYDYLEIKLKINQILMDLYEEEIYRKYRWYGFINRQKSEQKMINDFKDKFGEPDKVVILIGDFDEKGRYMKGFPPTKGVGMRRLFKKAGYNKLYLVNEYNTSCKLYETGQDLVKCRGTRTPLALTMLTDEKEDLQPLQKRETKNNSYESPEIISRDLNGSLNILLKGKCVIENKEIPEYMDIRKRKKNT